MKTGSLAAELESPQVALWDGASAFSPDGRTLVAVGFDGFAVWNVADGALRFKLDSYFDPGLQAVTFTPDGKEFAVGDANNMIALYDADTGDNKDAFYHDDAVTSVAFNPDGSILAAASTDGVIKLWNVQTGSEILSLTKYGGRADILGFTNDDSTIVVASTEGTAWRWNAVSGEQISIAHGYQFGTTHGTYPYPSSITLNSRSTLLATGIWISGRIYLWKPNGKSNGRLEIGYGLDIIDVAVSHDGRTIAGLSYGNIYLWDLESGNRLTGLRLHGASPRSIEFSPDNQTLAVGDSDGIVTLRNTKTGSTIAMLSGMDGDVNNLSFSPDGTIIAFTSYCYSCPPDKQNSIIQVWDVKTAKPLYVLQGHTGPVKGLAFSPDGTTLASVAGDDTLRFWDVAAGREIAALPEQAWALAFSHHGTMIATSSTDGTVRLWGVPQAP